MRELIAKKSVEKYICYVYNSIRSISHTSPSFSQLLFPILHLALHLIVKSICSNCCKQFQPHRRSVSEFSQCHDIL